MPRFNVPDDWNNYWTRCEVCGTRYHRSEGACCEPEPELGKADTFEGFQDQLDELSGDQWEALQRLMYASDCPKLVAFFEAMELVSDDG